MVRGLADPELAPVGLDGPIAEKRVGSDGGEGDGVGSDGREEGEEGGEDGEGEELLHGWFTRWADGEEERRDLEKQEMRIKDSDFCFCFRVLDKKSM